MNPEQVSLSLLPKLVSESAVLTSAGSSFQHCGDKTERSCDFDDRPIIDIAAETNGNKIPIE